ncbi:MAG: arylesterase [Gammaproteobacteria bacterium]|jgi:lysophospholipase L1-like esterase
MNIKITAHSVAAMATALLLVFSISGCDQIPQLKPLGDDAVILAFGDSLTFGTGAKQEQAYPVQLQTLVSRTVINAGIPGEITRNGLRRLPTLLKQHQPELVIICHGGNDILRRLNLQQTRSNIQQMIDISRAHGAQVVLVGVPEFGLFLSSAEFYTELAEHNHLPIENTVLSEILKNNTWKSDQIHPNAAGYNRMAKRLVQLLKKSAAI